ncbi:MAG: GTP-binding protein, partial [Flavobacteriales bacterium]
MKQYDSKHIKNIVLLGHQGSGKTTLAEDMLFESGVINRRGTIEGKNTVSDYHEMEQERQSSIHCTVMNFEWKDCKINLLDTPGFDDFSGEAVAALKVADTAVLALHAQHGVEVGTSS